jgi:hypothetical protein
MSYQNTANLAVRKTEKLMKLIAFFAQVQSKREFF